MKFECDVLQNKYKVNQAILAGRSHLPMNTVHVIKISNVISTILANVRNSKEVPDFISALKGLGSNRLKD